MSQPLAGCTLATSGLVQRTPEGQLAYPRLSFSTFARARRRAARAAATRRRLQATTRSNTRLLRGYYEATTRLLQGYYVEATTRLLCGYYGATTRFYYEATTRLLPGYYQATTRLLSTNRSQARATWPAAVHGSCTAAAARLVCRHRSVQHQQYSCQLMSSGQP